jgi:hypothetical protein
MKKYEFFGASDDLFCVCGSALDEQCDSSQGSKMTYSLGNEKEKVILIHGQYAENGDCWSITIEPVSEDLLPLAGWSFEYNPKDYGCQLFVTTPEDIECNIYQK